MKKIFLKISLSAFLAVLSLLPLAGQAGLTDAFGPNSHLFKAAKQAEYNTEVEDPAALIGLVIEAMLSLVGVIFLVLMIYGGFLWMTARGEETQVTKAKNLITAAIVGIIIILSAYAITYFVVDILTKNTIRNNGLDSEQYAPPPG